MKDISKVCDLWSITRERQLNVRILNNSSYEELVERVKDFETFYDEIYSHSCFLTIMICNSLPINEIIN